MFSHVGAVASDVARQFRSEKAFVCARRTFKVGHVGPDIRVQGVDDHLPIGGSGDFDAAIDQAGGRRRSSPRIIFTNVLCLREEVGKVALVELLLASRSSAQQVLAGGVEGSMEHGEEDEGVLVQDATSLVVERAEDVDVLEHVVGVWRRVGLDGGVEGGHGGGVMRGVDEM